MMPTKTRRYTPFDHFIIQLDRSLQAIHGDLVAQRPYPAKNVVENHLTEPQRKHSAGLMRVNHTGEVCAQALYNAQSLVASDPAIRATLIKSGEEETDHLAWTHQRLQELKSHRSYLNIFWYWNSFMIGLVAGFAGDSWSLGFVEETEIQVGKHLQGHLNQLSKEDQKSRFIIEQMQSDEAHHADQAKQQGAKALPKLVKLFMTVQAKVMTTLAYWI